MEATQVKTEEAVQAPGKKEPPKLKVPKKKKKWLKRLIIAVVVLAAIFLIFIRPMMWRAPICLRQPSGRT